MFDTNFFKEEEVMEMQQGKQALIPKFISFILHPALIPTMVALVIVGILEKEAVSYFTSKDVYSWIINIFISTFFFPVLFVFLLKALKFIPSIQLRTQKSRIVPLIGIMVFYFWVNEVFRNIEASNFYLRIFILACFWNIIAVFISNIFLKVSLHTSAMGGAIGLFGIYLFLNPNLNSLMVMITALFLAGIVGTSRLFLKAHNGKELWIGYIIGGLIQVAAYIFLTYLKSGV